MNVNGIENNESILVLLLLVSVCLVAYFLIKNHIVKLVKKSSHVLHELEIINAKIKYMTLEDNHLYSYVCFSRAEFNRFDLDNYFIEIINGNFSHFKKIIKTIEHNKREVAKYKRLLNKIDFTKTEEIAKSSKIPYTIYRYIENSSYCRMILKDPTTDVSIICRKEYTTPARKTHTWSDITYNYKDLVHYYEEAQKIKEQREIRSGQIEYERSLMTASLRYEILKRDNYRCQLCGSSAQDGVKLHIDHIVPVSKGGHTTTDNLRVLCDRCNLGKSDKLE